MFTRKRSWWVMLLVTFAIALDWRGGGSTALALGPVGEGADAAAVQRGLVGEAMAQPACEPTRPDALGPFYVPDAPLRWSVGQGHVLTGVVRSSVDCSPIAGAWLEFWLAGPNGQYDDDHRATMFSDAAGVYRFESNLPPSYGNRPPHIHIRASAEGYRTLITQYYPSQGQTEGTFDIVLAP